MRHSFTQNTEPERRGIVVVLAAVFMVVIFAFLAFSVDVGYITLVKGQLHNAADASALAAAMEMTAANPGDVLTNVEQAALEVAAANPAGDYEGVQLNPADGEVEVGRRTWNQSTGEFDYLWGAAATPYNVVKVTASRGGADSLPLFFAPVLGHNTADLRVSAIAGFQPRDLMLVLDYSGSMNDDSELKSIDKLPQADIEDNLFQIWEDLGSPTYGNMEFEPQTLAEISPGGGSAISVLGLDGVPYPYPSGSWSDFINYVQDSNNIDDAGYEDKYGYLTLINYWLEKRPMASQTPDLWKASAQPITALKDAVSVFTGYLKSVQAEDNVGLAVYTYPADGGAKLERGLGTDLDPIDTISRQRQAAHYDRYTNIGAGMQKARIELENNARSDADLVMVLMTDGIANRPNGSSFARQFALQEADRAAAANIKIMTVSLGINADTALMQQISDGTGGTHFNVPGGSSVADYTAQLQDVFREIASDRDVKLLQ